VDSEGKIVPQAVGRCRVCGHEEPEPIVVRAPHPPDGPAPTLTRDQLMAKADAMRREFMWRSIENGVRTQGFPIYVAAGWPARVTQSGSEDDGRLTSVTVAHFRSRDAKNSRPGTQPELTVTTERDDPRATGALDRAQLAVRRWARRDDSSRLRPDVSNAASALRHQARSRHDHAAHGSSLLVPRPPPGEGQDCLPVRGPRADQPVPAVGEVPQAATGRSPG
jgi:hypothetical protein